MVLTAANLLAAAAQSTGLPEQSGRGDTFGQPPLILHAEGDFYIQALTWLDGTTAIHDHAFAGAFMVLDGQSLHVEHSFDLAERSGEDRLAVGTLSPGAAEALSRGAIRRIEPGSGFIHALFHLRKPTVTIVVRNGSAGLPYPQYRYAYPGLAWDDGWSNRTWTRRLQSVEALARLDAGAAFRLVDGLVKDVSVWEGFQLVRYWCAGHGWDAKAEQIVLSLAARDAALEPVLGRAMAEEIAIRKILLRRGTLHELRHRTFLALLVNVDDAASLIRVIRQMVPEQQPKDFLIDCVEELASPALSGLSGLMIPPEQVESWRQDLSPGEEGVLLHQVRSLGGQRVFEGLVEG